MTILLDPIANLKPSQIRQGWYAKRRNYNGKPGYRLHEGQDYACPTGTEVRAIAGGSVALARSGSATAGTWVVLIHDDQRYSSRYLHLSKLLVKRGRALNAGDVLGLSGSTGVSSAPHLHFDMQAHEDILKELECRGLSTSGRAAPGTGGRRNVPVEQFFAMVHDKSRWADPLLIS